MGTMLYSLEVPSKGGDTMLTNYIWLMKVYLRLKSLLEDMEAEYSAALKHAGGRRNVMNATRFDVANLDRAVESFYHPIVRKHPETGQKALYISSGHLLRLRICELKKVNPY